MPSPGAPPIAPPPRRLGLVLGLVVGGVGALLIAGVITTAALISSSHAPSASVSRFLDLLVAGHSHAAVQQLAPRPDAALDLTADDVYEGAKHRIQHYAIVSTTAHGRQADVVVRLTNDNGSWRETFHLTSQRKFLVLWDVWAVDGGSLPVVGLNDSRPVDVSVTVNGVEIQKSGSQHDAYVAFPGTYRFALVPDNSFVKADAHEAQVTSFEHDTKVTLQPQLTDDGIAQARAAVDAFLQRCIQQPVLAPTGNCGYEVIDNGDGTVLSNITWSIKQRPVVSFAPWDQDGWAVTTDTAGVIEMDADARKGGLSGEVFALFDSYDVQGFVTLDTSGQMTFTSTYEGDTANTPNA
jgi:hypothetical protein